ncbi:DUF3164 family protein [Ruegeria atlantica]|uniref:DUF3164 family protein n=1 Tax=Ruegeria atlantica TaxID=81569 RepID=UPI0020C2151F|nr:DUF3164 family protein [Ruegeria atlantica]
MSKRKHDPFDAPEGMDGKTDTAGADDATIEIDGVPHMRDHKARLIPLDLIRAQDQLQDEMVRKVIRYAGDLSAQISRFRGHTMDDISAFDALLAAEYGGPARASVKGNRTYLSYDGCLKVQVQITERIEFGPELQVARDLVEECLAEWSAGSRDEIRAIVGHAFQVDKEGQISRSAIYSLLRHEIDDDRWRSAMQAIRDAMRVVGSKSYIRCYRRKSSDAGWQPITIDLAKAG